MIKKTDVADRPMCHVCRRKPLNLYVHIQVHHPAAWRAYERRISRDRGIPPEESFRKPRTCVECGRSYTEDKEKYYKIHRRGCGVHHLATLLLDGQQVYLVRSGNAGFSQVQDPLSGHRRLLREGERCRMDRELGEEERAEAERIYLGGRPA